MRLRLVALALLAASCASSGTTQSVTYQWTVRVVTEDRLPIEGALVSFDAYRFPPTDRNGETVGPLRRGGYTLAVGAPGYRARLFSVDVYANWAISVGLEREP